MKTKLIIALFTIIGYVNAQGTWTQKSNFTSTGMREAACFSIDSLGYVGITETGEFWAFNPNNNQWTQKANLPAGIGFQPTTFAIGNMGYMGFGYLYPNPEGTNEFWEYNPASDSWSQKTSIPGAGKRASFGFSIGNKGYVGGGFYNGNEFWEYDTQTDSWTQKNNSPQITYTGGNAISGITFAIANKGYVTGTNCNFYQYDPSMDTWTKKAYIYAVNGQTFIIGNKGYVYNAHGDLNEYDISLDQWTTKANFPGTTLCYPIGFSITTKGYIGIGGIFSNNGCTLSTGNELWEYCDTCFTTGIKTYIDNSFSVFPNPFSIQTTLHSDNPFQNATLTVYNCFGQSVKQIDKLFGQTITLQRDDLPSGVYFIRLSQNDKTFTDCKLIVTDN